LLDLAKTHQLAGHLEKSLTLLDEFLKTQPTEIEPYQVRIALLTSMGREAEILPSLRAFVGRDKHNVDLHLLLADQYASHSGEETKAQEEYESVIRENPRPHAYHGLFNLLKNEGKVDEVLAKLDRSLAAANPKEGSAGDASEAANARAMLDAIRQDPELVRQMIPLGISRGRRGQRLDFSTRYFLAALAARTHQLEAAERFFQDCLKEPNGFPGFSPQEHEIYSGLLQVLDMEGKNEEIIDVCREGLRNAQATNRLLFHKYMAQSLSRLGKTQEALGEIEQAVQLADEKNFLYYRLLRAGILADGNQFDKAIQECQELLKNSVSADDIHEIRMRLYAIYSSEHENEKAEEQLRRILKDFPDDATAHNDLGYMMADQGKNLAESEELIRKAIDLDRRQKRKEAHVGPDDHQDNAAFVDSLGWVLFRTGRFTEALQELQRAATLQDGNDPVIWDHLGDVYFRMDQAAKAQESWTKAVSLYENEKRRKQDDQYRELKHKLELLKFP
jgi:tetratricopeptide (TPR) repeat protein